MTQTLDRPWKRLKAAREAAGFKTARSFSDTLGIGHNTYGNHERPPRSEGGKGRAFDQERAAAYATALSRTLPGLTADWLLHNAGPVPAGLLANGESPILPEVAYGLDEDLFVRAVADTVKVMEEEGFDLDPQEAGLTALQIYQDTLDLRARHAEVTADDPDEEVRELARRREEEQQRQVDLARNVVRIAKRRAAG